MRPTAVSDLIDRTRRAELHTRVRELIGDAAVIRFQRTVAPAFRRSLTWLARIYWTDKGGNHSYIPLYERHLHPLRHRAITVLEIGIGGYQSLTWGGASLRMWRDYFRRGEIHGVDINRKAIDEPRIHVHCGSQADVAFLRSLAAEHGPFDVIIDDGSHVASHIRTSFTTLFDHVRPGGWYVIEDMGTAYDSNHEGGPPGHPGTSVALVKDLVDEVNRGLQGQHAPARVSALHVYEEIAFIRKA